MEMHGPNTLMQAGLGKSKKSKSNLFHKGEEAGAPTQNTASLPITGAGDAENGELKFSASFSDYMNKWNARNDSKMRMGAAGQNTPCNEAKAPRFDFWGKGTYEYFKNSRSSGHFWLAQAGADYVVQEGLLIGFMAQFDHTKFDDKNDADEAFGYKVSGRGWMVGPYMAVNVIDNIYFDGRVLVGRTTNNISPYRTYVDTFKTTRWLASARLSGSWSWKKWSLTPSVEYLHFQDKSKSYVDNLGVTISSQRVRINQLSFGPRLNYKTPIKNSNATFGAFLDIKGIMDMTPVSRKSFEENEKFEPDASRLKARLEAGFSLNYTNGFSMGLSGGVETSGESGISAASVSGRVTIPFSMPKSALEAANPSGHSKEKANLGANARPAQSATGQKREVE